MTTGVKETCRTLIKKCAVGSGVFHLRRWISARSHAIFTFHKIRPNHAALDRFDSCPSITVANFRETLLYIRDHFRLMSLHDLALAKYAKRPAATVTFDDGWRDNYDLAFPILQELSIPATIFVTTGKIGVSQPFWQQQLGNLFRLAQDNAFPKLADELRLLADNPNSTALGRDQYRSVISRWKTLDDKTRSEHLNRLSSYAPEKAAAERQFLTVTEIQTMSRAGVAFGSHTVTHPILTRVSLEQVRTELKDSKNILAELCGQPVDTLAYPNGDYSSAIAGIAADLGYRIGCTTVPRRVSATDDRLLLPRIETTWDGEKQGQTAVHDDLKWCLR